MTMFPNAARKLNKDLGYGMSLSSILSGVSFSVCLFFYLYTASSFLNILVYPLIDRVTFYLHFQKDIVNEHVDNIIVIAAASSWFLFSLKKGGVRYSFAIIYGVAAIILAVTGLDNTIFHVITLLSLPLIIGISLYYYHHRRYENLLNFDANLTLRYISLAVIAIGVTWTVVSILAFFLAPDLESIARDSYANQLFLLLSSFATFYIFLLIFCLPVKVLFRDLSRILKLDIKEDVLPSFSNNDEQNRVKTQTRIVFLSIAVILPVVLTLIPQHPSINIDNQDIGVDTHYYVTWVGELVRSTTLSDFVYESFIVQGQDGDRPFSLIFVFLVYQIAGGELSEVIEHLPIILGPGIVLAIYFLTLQLTRDEKISLIAAFFAAVSFHTLIGIYAGFYANWFALIVGYISIAFLFRYLRSGRTSNILVFSILLIATLFFHVYTWTILAAVTSIFLLTMLVIQNRKKKNNIGNNNIGFFTSKKIILLLLFGILPSVTIDVAKVALTGSSGGLGQDIELVQTSLGIDQFHLRWEILSTTMHDSLAGVFSNFIILGLGLLWLFKSNIREHSTIFLMIFLSIGLVPLFIGNWIIQARVFYNIPFEIPAAIALYYVYRRSGSLLVPLAACTWLVAVSLFTVMNYYLVPVPGMR
jgi:hypothetical protein